MFGRKNVTLLDFSGDYRPIITGVSPICEKQENQIKIEEINEKLQENTVSTLTIDQIMEKHPLLDKTVEVLLKYLYNWLMVVDSSLR